MPLNFNEFNFAMCFKISRNKSENVNRTLSRGVVSNNDIPQVVLTVHIRGCSF